MFRLKTAAQATTIIILLSVVSSFIWKCENIHVVAPVKKNSLFVVVFCCYFFSLNIFIFLTSSFLKTYLKTKSSHKRIKTLFCFPWDHFQDRNVIFVCVTFFGRRTFSNITRYKERGKIKVNIHVMFSCSLGLCETAKYGIYSVMDNVIPILIQNTSGN